MTSSERKENSERLLASFGIPAHDSLPVIEEQMYSFQSARKVAERILILTYLNCIASDPSLQQEVMMFLIREKLWDEATPDEKLLFHNPQLSGDDVDRIFWRKESIWAMLWAIGHVDKLEHPDREVDLYEIFPQLPGFFEPTDKFIQRARSRDSGEILGQQDFYFRLNWALRQQDIESLNRGVVHERDVALSWMTGFLDHWI